MQPAPKYGLVSQGLIAVALSVVFCEPLRAQLTDPPYLVEFPTVDRVLARIEGRNERDTAARQLGTFYHLRDMIERLSDGRNYRNKLTTDEQRLMTSYGEARGTISLRVESTLTQNDREDWFIARGSFETSDDYRAEVLATFFSKAWADAYLKRAFADNQQMRRETEARYGPGWSGIEFKLPAAVRNSLLVQLAIAALLLAFAAWRESRPFGIDAGDLNLLRAGLWGRYRIGTLTGKAVDVHQRAYETKTTSTDSSGRVDISYTTEYTTALTIHGDDGTVEIPESKLCMSSLEDGANMSAAWVSKPSGTRGPLLLLMHHDLNTWHNFDKTLHGYMKAWLWPALPLAWLVLTMFRLSRYSEGSEAVLGFIGLLILAVLLGYYWCRNRITAWRIARYHAKGGSALKERLNTASRDLQSAEARKQQAIRDRRERRGEKS
jgi:hypothetical protein